MGEEASTGCIPSTERAVEWLNEHGDALYAYALLRLADPHAAEDAVQDTLLSAIEANFDGRSAERTWLTGILRHKVIDSIRRTSRQNGWTVSLEDLTRPSDNDVRHYSAPRADEWSKGESRNEHRAVLWDALCDLPDPMRQAFCLRALDGLSTHVVCEILDITPGNLWTLIHRARLRLRDRLSDEFGEVAR